MRFAAITGHELDLHAETLRDVVREVDLEADDLARRIGVAERLVVGLDADDDLALLLDARHRIGPAPPRHSPADERERGDRTQTTHHFPIVHVFLLSGRTGAGYGPRFPRGH